MHIYLLLLERKREGNRLPPRVPSVAGMRVGREAMVTSQVTSDQVPGCQMWVLGFTQESIQEQAIVMRKKIY